MAKILFIEDDPLINKIYSTRLKADGHEVFSAENGEDGLAKANDIVPDVIVLDVMMPRVDGFAVLEKLRQDPRFKEKPVLMYSNLNNEEEINRAKQMGVTEFLVKADLSPTQMVAKIKQYIDAMLTPVAS
ncbi:PleD family two-component system response regulator [Patescibacteria group bacterium]